jgi:hypothetical protein
MAARFHRTKYQREGKEQESAEGPVQISCKVLIRTYWEYPEIRERSIQKD